MTSPSPLRIESLCGGEQGGVAARQSALPPELRQLHRAVLQAFLTTGRPPHQRDLPLAIGVDRDEAFRQLRDADLVHLDGDGYVRAAYPFSGRMTGHFVQLDDGLVVSVMCAIDALGIPLMTGRDAVAVSNDPVDGHPIRVERRGDGWRWSPGETVVLLAQSGGCGPAADCLCPATTFHTSRQRDGPSALPPGLDRPGARPGWGDRRRAMLVRVVARPRGRRVMIVEMLHTEACPNAVEYLPRLRTLVADAGVTEPVRVRTINDPEQAQHERFLGSPTVRVNGRDVDPGAAGREDYGLSCRLYTGPDGMRGTPPDVWVLTMLGRRPADGSDGGPCAPAPRR